MNKISNYRLPLFSSHLKRSINFNVNAYSWRFVRNVHFEHLNNQKFKSISGIQKLNFQNKIFFSSLDDKKNQQLELQPNSLEKLSLWGKTKAVLKSYGNGIGKLYSGWKTIFKLRSKPKSELTWKEISIYYWTKFETYNSLPMITLFCIPLIGYIAPLLGYFFPVLLPQSFALPSQKLASKKKLIEERNVISKEFLKYFSTNPNLNLRLSNIEKVESDKEFLKLCNDVNLSFPLSKLERKYLLLFCQFVNFPFCSVIPSYFLRKRLLKYGKFILDGDIALNHQSLTSLTQEDLENACEERALPPNSISLETWLYHSRLVISTALITDTSTSSTDKKQSINKQTNMKERSNSKGLASEKRREREGELSLYRMVIITARQKSTFMKLRKE